MIYLSFTKIMMYGIITYLIGMSVFSLCQVDFLCRFYANRPVRFPKGGYDGTGQQMLCKNGLCDASDLDSVSGTTIYFSKPND